MAKMVLDYVKNGTEAIKSKQKRLKQKHRKLLKR